MIHLMILNPIRTIEPTKLTKFVPKLIKPSIKPHNLKDLLNQKQAPLISGPKPKFLNLFRTGLNFLLRCINKVVLCSKPISRHFSHSSSTRHSSLVTQ